MKHVKLLVIMSCVFMSTTIGCGEHEDDHEHNNVNNTHTDETIEDEACEHMEEGPAVSISAVDGDMPPEANKAHTRFDITLLEKDSMYSGHVRLVVEEDGDYVVFLNKDIATTLTRVDGDEVTPEESEGAVDQCSTVIAKHQRFDLKVGRYDLAFGPTDQTQVQLVFEHDEHDEHDGHDH